MDLKELANWLHEMQDLTGGCVLNLHPRSNGSLELALRWQQAGRSVGYARILSGVELQHMHVLAQAQVLDQIRRHVADATTARMGTTGEQR